MLDDSTAHYSEIINNAAQLMSTYFQKNIRFSKVTQLSEPDRRNIILRLQIDNPTTEMPRTLILKKNSVEKHIFGQNEIETEVEQMSRFAHDWAGIEFLTQIGSHHAPHYYAGSLEHKFILIEDLGLSHTSLVGPLTRASSVMNMQEAELALTAYVRRLGKMQADTYGKSSSFISILNNVYPQALRYHTIPELDGQDVIKQLKQLTGDESKELANEIDTILKFSQAGNEFTVFLHGDICPDNVYYQNNEMRFIDFEFSDFGNALIDGVYLRMNMPSCWCAKAVPSSILEKMEAIYRTELRAGVLAAVDDNGYKKQLVYACGYWLLKTIKQLNYMDLIDHEWICPSGPLDADSKWDPEKNAFRPRILSRLDAFISYSQATKQLPILCEAALHLRAYLKNIWPETQPIDLFPVFKS